ncbi:MAG TPA: hypothetical protein VMZ06_09290 [Candidatus Bathyarchaeia archaeon]|nr:hypothetical protein [Candidatus Bathyarchaeia archaeon]
MDTKVNVVVERVARHVNMGPQKRNECVLRHVIRLVGAPGAGTGQAAGSKDASWAESQSWYDLIDNTTVSVRMLRELRAHVVREGFDPSVEVAVFHDITELDFTRHASKQKRMEIGDPELAPSIQLFALILRAGGWLGPRTDPMGPTVLMRGMLQVMTMFSMVNQFSDLIGSLAKIYRGGSKNAYTW